MSKRVLVTGSRGFIGSELISFLANHKVNYDILDRDLVLFSDTEGLKKLLQHKDCVIHLAGKIQGDKSDLIEANIDSTSYLLKAISRLKKKPILVFSSTFAVYSPPYNLIREESEVSPRNMYCKTKLQAEKLVEKYSNEFKIPALILRFSNVYGPNMSPFTHSVVATFMDQAIKGLPLTINSTGEQTRDFIYVTDVIDALMKSINLDSTFKGFEKLNICSGIPTSMNQLAYEIGKVIGKKIEIIYPTLKDIDGNWIGVNSKAKDILGWQPKVGLEDGIKKCYEKNK